MDDHICSEFDRIGHETRQIRERFRTRPTVSRPIVPGRPPRDCPVKSSHKNRKTQKAAYAQCVADGVCTICRKTKADGRLCAPCHEKEKERWKKKSRALSERRAVAAAERQKHEDAA